MYTVPMPGAKMEILDHILMRVGWLVVACLVNMAAARGDDMVRVGLVQMTARLHDREFNLQQAEAGIRRAAARGAQIVCTPEAAVQGYPRVSFPAGSRMDDPKFGRRARQNSRGRAADPGARHGTLRAARPRTGRLDRLRHGRKPRTASCSTPPS